MAASVAAKYLMSTQKTSLWLSKDQVRKLDELGLGYGQKSQIIRQLVDNFLDMEAEKGAFATACVLSGRCSLNLQIPDHKAEESECG